MLVVRISKSLADLLYDSLVESMGTLALVCNRNGPHPIGRRKTTKKKQALFTKKDGRVIPYNPDWNRDTECCEYYHDYLSQKRSRPKCLQPLSVIKWFAIMVVVVHAFRKFTIHIKLCSPIEFWFYHGVNPDTH